MTRRFLDDIRGEINAYLVTGGNTTADELRPSLLDMIDSTIQDECSISSIAATPAMSTTDSWTKINTTVYGESEGGDGVFLKPSFANGEITTNTTPGFTYTIGAQVAFEGGANDRFDFSILQNGLPIGPIDTETGEGPGDPISATPRAFVRSAGADDVFSLGIKSGNAVDSIDILDCSLYVVIQPTNNP